MKKYIALILLLITSFYSFSQQREYVLTCGDDIIDIVWTEQMIDNEIHLHTKQEGEISKYVMSKSFQTIKWSVENKLQHTNFTIESKNGKYYITGVFKGEDVSEVVKSKGEVWFQNIAYNADLSLKGKENIKFECFRPTDLKLFIMEAERKGVSKATNGDSANKVNVHLTGFLSKFFNCIYLFDIETSMFIKYRTVSGMPGTPETIITIAK